MSLPLFPLQTAADNPARVPFDLFKRLKEETAENHRQVEQRVPVFREDFTRDDYTRLVERFYGFWAPLEIRLAASRNLQDPELALASRLKGPLLRKDLIVLGRDPDTIPQCSRLPGVGTILKGLGCLYVLEGSTLGSRFISQRIESHLQLRVTSGAAFFNAYGESVGLRWNEFKLFVTDNVREVDGDEVVTAARKTFDCLHTWLGQSAG